MAGCLIFYKKNVYRLLCFVLWSNIWHYKKLIITYYALICPLNILRHPTRFSQKASGIVSTRVTRYNTPGPHAVYVY